MLIFVVELHFNSMATCLISAVKRELMVMMFLVQQVLVMIESTCVVGFLNWKNVMSVITAVRMLYDPSDDSYSSPKQPSVMFVAKIALLQQIFFCIKNVYICVFHFLLVLFVILLISLILVYKCTLLNLMEV